MLIILAWVITDGDWNLFPAAKSYEEYYDGQAQSLLHGRIDVPLQSILAERFVRDGKYYGYFGPTPAFPRMLLNLLMPDMYGHWSHFSMLMGSLCGMAILILLYRKLEALLDLKGKLWALLRVTLLVSVFLGSTNVFISTESMVYQEAIMWAAALAFAHAVFLVIYLIEHKRKWLVLSCAAAFLAFNAKISSGAGPLVSLAIVDATLLFPWDRLRDYWAAPKLAAPQPVILLVSVTLLVSAASWAGLNYWKYGLVFTSQPLHLTPHPDPERLRRIKGDPFSLTNIPLTLSIYLNPANVRFKPHFPWAFLMPADTATHLRLIAAYPNSHYDGIEPVASLTASMPILFLGALSGLAFAFLMPGERLRFFRAPLIGTLGGTFLILGWGYLSQRFLHDAMPWLALGSAIAVAHIPLLPNRAGRIAATSLLFLGTMYGIWVNSAFAALHKRVDTLRPDSDTKRVAFLDFSQDVTNQGLRGAFAYLTQWRKYILATDFHHGNVTSSNTIYSNRIDVAQVWYDGKPPGMAEYTVDFPSNGRYEASILYSSPDSRPLDLVVNRVPAMRGLCGAPTGGPYLSNERWCKLAILRAHGETTNFALVSEGKFPMVRMIRFVKLE